MTMATRCLVIVLLGATAWRVYSLRSLFASQAPEAEQIEMLRERLETIPLELPELNLQGRSQPETDEVIDRSGAQAHVAYVYRGSQEPPHKLYVGSALFLRGYFHAPRGCLPSRGWEIIRDGQVAFDAYPVESRAATMRRIVVKQGTERILVHYWFQSGHRVGSDVGATSWFRFLDLLNGRSVKPVHIIAVYTFVDDGDIDAAESAALRFIRAIGPYVNRAVQ